MANIEVKEIVSFEENGVKNTRLILSENGKDTEIILQGDGKIRTAVLV